MVINDPVGDMLTRIRNAAMVRHDKLTLPSSKLKVEVAKCLKNEGFVADFIVHEKKPQNELTIVLKYGPSREPVITATGRIRANASYAACRNGIMQGLAADGAIHALWDLWRAGYKIVNFIHDEIICEVPEDEHLPARVAEIERLMIEGMQKVVPGANVRVETSVRRSFSKTDIIKKEKP
jgi:ribosomal protein S8